MPLPVAALALAFSAIIGGVHPGADSLLGTGVSRALATARAAQIRDVRYALSFDLTERDSSRGTVTARFRVVKRGDVILDFRGQRLGAVEVNGSALTSPRFNGAHLSIPARSVVVGENVVTVSFVTKIAAAGASIIRYHDATDGAEYLYTLLVPADANQLFPCFDQPDLKARVTLRINAPSEWRVLANAPEVAPTSGSGSHGTLAEHQFGETEPISTYLIAFAAGPWSTVTAKTSKKPIELLVKHGQQYSTVALSYFEGLKYPRLERIEGELKAVNTRIDALESKVDALDSKFEGKFDALTTSIGFLDGKLESFRRKLSAEIRRVDEKLSAEIRRVEGTLSADFVRIESNVDVRLVAMDRGMEFLRRELLAEIRAAH